MTKHRPVTMAHAPYYLVAVDPGPHTGMVLVLREKAYGQAIHLIRQVTFARTVQDDDDQLEGLPYKHVLGWLNESLPASDQYPRYLTMESFTTFHIGVGASSAAIATVRMCGAIEAWAQQTDLYVHWQTPASRVPFQESVRRNWKPDSPHTMSALAHALHWIQRHDLEAQMTQLAFTYTHNKETHET